MNKKTKIILIGTGAAVAAITGYLVYSQTKAKASQADNGSGQGSQPASQIPSGADTVAQAAQNNAASQANTLPAQLPPALQTQNAPAVTMADLQKLDWYNQAGVHIYPLTKYLKDYNPVTKVATHTDPSWTGVLVANNKIAWTRSDGLKDSWTGASLSGLSGMASSYL